MTTPDKELAQRFKDVKSGKLKVGDTSPCSTKSKKVGEAQSSKGKAMVQATTSKEKSVEEKLNV